MNGSDNIIQFKPREKAPVMTCACGSGWWLAKVSIENSRITGWSVNVACIECGEKVTI